MKCPKCGSNNYAEILYGLPVLYDELEDDSNNNKVLLVGCILFKDSPKYYCNNCGFKFGSEPLYYNKEESDYVDYRDTVEFFFFSIGGFDHGYDKIVFRKKSSSVTLLIMLSLISGKEKVTKELTFDDWSKFLNTLYLDLLIHEWKSEYYNFNIFDGTQWEVSIALENGSTVKYRGSNDFPVYWNDFIKLINPFTEFYGIKFQ